MGTCPIPRSTTPGAVQQTRKWPDPAPSHLSYTHSLGDLRQWTVLCALIEVSYAFDACVSNRTLTVLCKDVTGVDVSPAAGQR